MSRGSEMDDTSTHVVPATDRRGGVMRKRTGSRHLLLALPASWLLGESLCVEVPCLRPSTRASVLQERFAGSKWLALFTPLLGI